LKYGLLTGRAGTISHRPGAPARAPAASDPSEAVGPPRRGPRSRLGFIISCMGRLADLHQTLGRFVAQPDCSCVVVDYSCPERSGEWVAANYPSVRVVRVEGRAEFQRAEACNLGAAAADAHWLCFTDADIQIAPNFAQAIFPRLEAGCYL